MSVAAACKTQDIRRSAGMPQSVMAASAASNSEIDSPELGSVGDLRRAEQSIIDLEDKIFSSATYTDLADIIFPVSGPSFGIEDGRKVSKHFKQMWENPCTCEGNYNIFV